MVAKKEIYEDIWNFVKRVQEVVKEFEKYKLDRRARRALAILQSQGIVDLLIFGYSKAGKKGKSGNNMIEELHKAYTGASPNVDLGGEENGEWCLITYFIITNPMKRMKLFANGKSVDLLSNLKILLEQDLKKIWKLEKLAAQYLNVLARIWQAYSSG